MAEEFRPSPSREYYTNPIRILGALRKSLVLNVKDFHERDADGSLDNPRFAPREIIEFGVLHIAGELVKQARVVIKKPFDSTMPSVGDAVAYLEEFIADDIGLVGQYIQYAAATIIAEEADEAGQED